MIELMPSCSRCRMNFCSSEASEPMKMWGDSSSSSALTSAAVRPARAAARSRASDRALSVTETPVVDGYVFSSSSSKRSPAAALTHSILSTVEATVSGQANSLTMVADRL